MPRKTHVKKGEEERRELLKNKEFIIKFNPYMQKFLEVEAKQASLKYKMRITPTEVIRRLVIAYYEKKTAGLLVGIED